MEDLQKSTCCTSTHELSDSIQRVETRKDVLPFLKLNLTNNLNPP
jgi:hypothetical protein